MSRVRYRPKKPGLVYGVTIGQSARGLLRGQLAWFREHGWDVTLVTTPDEAAEAASTREGVHLRTVPMTRRMSPLQDARALVRWIRLLREIRPSAVNVSTPKAGLLGGLAARLMRVPKRIYIVRGLRLEGSSGLEARILWLAEWLTMKTATDVFFVSRSLAAEAHHRRLLSPKKSWLIGEGSSNGVNAAAISKRASEVDREALRAQLGLSEDDFVVGFIGRVTPDKGVDTLVRAFSNTRLDSRARLLIIGPVEDAKLVPLIDSLGHRVTVLGWTSDVWGHLPAVDVLCLPTIREGFPNVVLEAACVAIPSITTRATGAIDSVLDGETGFLIDVGDASGLVERINRLATSPELLALMGRNSRERALTEFKPERVWAGLEEILTSAPHPQHAARIAEGSKK